ncbi:type 3 dihydrofolate reductase [Thiohalobacter sp. IOR34]|uniref:type 3 dihydrofolate reductase n=1 Tax=Thiohalobacter sp. IOR34 TaxID=3057176 RepID=UPI0025B05C58|nr:type 3 dihydrofolate reductase [Thiohalobacter sp. IOR34]WJW75894.1 type 3 dihydrofolate reductase [Thiohalobacter sp. IOR34]
MSRPILSLILAMDRNRVIGKDNALPWHLPADLQYFKRMTMGKPILMGRKTHESIGRPLPGRQNIVISSNPAFEAPGCTVVHSLDEALEAAGGAGEIMVIGGTRLFEQVLDRADRIYLTLIDHAFEGDTWFPELDAGWVEVSREDHAPDEKNPWPYSFILLERG